MEWWPFVRNFIVGTALQHTEYGEAVILIVLVSLVWIRLVPWLAQLRSRRQAPALWLRMRRENVSGVALTAALLIGGPHFLEAIGLSAALTHRRTSLACPPSQLTFSGGEGLVIEAGSATTVRLSRTHYNPPGTTPAIAARVAMAQGTILWSADGTEPHVRVTAGDPQFWVCRDDIQKFRATQGGSGVAAFNISYAW
jgi:hypothetical protein